MPSEPLALCKECLFELSFPGQMRCRVTISLLIINTSFLLPHKAHRSVHNAATEMGVGPGLLAGKGEMRANKSPRSLPPGPVALKKAALLPTGAALCPMAGRSWLGLPADLSLSNLPPWLIRQQRRPYCHPSSQDAAAASSSSLNRNHSSSSNTWDIFCMYFCQVFYDTAEYSNINVMPFRVNCRKSEQHYRISQNTRQIP